MAKENNQVSGRDHYAQLYKQALHDEVKWLELGASEKVNSIEVLLKQSRLSPTSLVELGCGTGAVILECERRGLASQLTAVDYSEEALSHLASVAPDVRRITADITDPAFYLAGDFDIAVLSHVLEHLEDPAAFLRSAMEKIRFKHLIAEVPLEDLPGSKVKNIFRDRRKNAAGHVQFFTSSRFKKLVTSVGLKIQYERRYFPAMTEEVVDFRSAKDRLSPAKRLFSRATGVYLPRALGPLWTHLYYSHLAVICSPVNERQR